MISREEAIEDCAELWAYLADTGQSKFYPEGPRALRLLYNEDRISREEYWNGCPLCERYFRSNCVDCPWPGKGEVRCQNDPESPYYDYYMEFEDYRRVGHHEKPDIETSKRLAQAVYDLVKTFLDK